MDKNLSRKVRKYLSLATEINTEEELQNWKNLVASGLKQEPEILQYLDESKKGNPSNDDILRAAKQLLASM